MDADAPPTHRGRRRRVADVEWAPVREVASLHRFEVFLFTAIGTVLVVRAFLAITGYPKIGGGGLHVAHVLWGGLLLGVAVVMGLIGMGSRIRTAVAFVGGIGFGLFIDEIGKFLTTDVNYFYRPAVAIIYLVFVAFFIVVRQILLWRKLNDRRRIALVAAAIGDQALGQLDRRDRDLAVSLLADLDQPNAATAALRTALLAQPIARRPVQTWLDTQSERARRLLCRLATNPLLQLAALGVLAWQIVANLTLYLDYLRITVRLEQLRKELDQISGTNSSFGFGFKFWYELVANLVVSALAAVAWVLTVVPWTRRWGLLLLNWALMLDILFNQFGTFEYSQFAALIGFGIELMILLSIRYLLRTDQIPDADRRLVSRWRNRPTHHPVVPAPPLNGPTTSSVIQPP